jgi:hypothetical protein
MCRLAALKELLRRSSSQQRLLVEKLVKEK